MTTESKKLTPERQRIRREIAAARIGIDNMNAVVVG